MLALTSSATLAAGAVARSVAPAVGISAAAAGMTIAYAAILLSAPARDTLTSAGVGQNQPRAPR
jgi:hypothetical protein